MLRNPEALNTAGYTLQPVRFSWGGIITSQTSELQTDTHYDHHYTANLDSLSSNTYWTNAGQIPVIHCAGRALRTGHFAGYWQMTSTVDLIERATPTPDKSRAIR